PGGWAHDRRPRGSHAIHRAVPDPNDVLESLRRDGSRARFRAARPGGPSHRRREQVREDVPVPWPLFRRLAEGADGKRLRRLQVKALRILAAAATATAVLLCGAWAGGALAQRRAPEPTTGTYPGSLDVVRLGEGLAVAGQPMQLSLFRTADAAPRVAR